MTTEHAEKHVHCNHWEPLPGGRQACCTCDHVEDVDNPEADRLRAALSRMVADHPFVLDGDNGAMVASWFINEAKSALEPTE